MKDRPSIARSLVLTLVASVMGEDFIIPTRFAPPMGGPITLGGRRNLRREWKHRRRAGRN